MSNAELAGQLLSTARSDLLALSNMRDPDAFDDRVFGFHAQRAVEKALKAWLSALGESPPYTHDLSLLLHKLDALGQSVHGCWQFLELTSFAVRFRYEDMPEDEEPPDRETLTMEIRGLVGRVEAIHDESSRQ